MKLEITLKKKSPIDTKESIEEKIKKLKKVPKTMYCKLDSKLYQNNSL